MRAATSLIVRDFDIAAVADSNQQIQDVLEQGKALSRFGQILGMKAEVKDATNAGGGRQSAAEAIDAGLQSDHPGSRRSDGVEEQR